MSEAAPATAAPVSRAAALCTDVLQGLLLACIVGWVLDVPRRLFGISLYTEQLLAVSLGLGLALSFVARRDRAPHWLEWLGAALSLGICLYITIRYEPLSYELAMLPIEGIVGSALLILMVLIATARTAGAVLVGIILLLTAWVFIGPHLPADFRTLPVSPQRLLVYLGLDVNGMIGAILAVAIIIVVPFTLMGQVLSRTGGSAYFADLAMAAMGNFRGGAAKIAVFGSALFGMISGAAVSNVMAVGIVTIPLMARSGFSPTRAAAIEGVGSTGGQLMPPVMGAAAFIMAEFLQVKYAAVAIAAIIPSILYYAALFMHVDLEAAKQKIGAAPVTDAPRFVDVLKSGWHFPIPIAFLIATLAWPEFFSIPIERAAIYTTAMIAVFSSIFGYRGHRVAPRDLARAILDTGLAALDIVLIGAAAGLVVGVLSVSGISFHAARAVTGQARGDADGGAHVRDVLRHAFHDHAARGDRRLRRGQHRPRARLERGLDRGGGRLEHVLRSIPFRPRSEPADGGAALAFGLEPCAQPAGHLRRHRRRYRIRVPAAWPRPARALRRRSDRHPDSPGRISRGRGSRLDRAHWRVSPDRVRVRPRTEDPCCVMPSLPCSSLSRRLPRPRRIPPSPSRSSCPGRQPG